MTVIECVYGVILGPSPSRRLGTGGMAGGMTGGGDGRGGAAAVATATAVSALGPPRV